MLMRIEVELMKQHVIYSMNLMFAKAESRLHTMSKKEGMLGALVIRADVGMPSQGQCGQRALGCFCLSIAHSICYDLAYSCTVHQLPQALNSSAVPCVTSLLSKFQIENFQIWFNGIYSNDRIAV